MTDSPLPDAASQLDSVNKELAALFQTEPAALSMGSDAALADDLVICGILGGKDVGKSTLINALAQQSVSAPSEEVGEGTTRPMAYVHAAMQDAVAHRLATRMPHILFDVTTHEADAIRGVALIDLPDFDSEFRTHLEIVRGVAPLLDRLLWVQTPRKIGDRAWVEMFREVCIKDPSNVRCVLNKVDQLLADSDPFVASGNGQDHNHKERAERFWAEQGTWVSTSVAAAGCPHSPDRRFLVAAAFPDVEQFIDRIGELWDDPTWHRYGTDRETVANIAALASADIDRLRGCVLAPVSSEQRRGIKTANRETERRVNAQRIRRHFDLDRTMQCLSDACDPSYHQRILNDAVGPAYCASVARAVRGQMKPETQLADELLERRVEDWPLLRLTYWPLGWLARAVGRRVSTMTSTTGGDTGDPFDAQGRPLAERVESIRAHLLDDQAVIAKRLGIDADVPSAGQLTRRVATLGRRLPRRLDAQLLEELPGRHRRPSVLGKAALWLILIWFPLGQPVLAGVLQMYAEGEAKGFAFGLYKIVSALSAPHLLAGLAVVVTIFVAIIAGMYSRGLRAIRRERGRRDESSPVIDAVDELFVSEVVAPMASPFYERLERLNELTRRLDGHSTSLPTR